MNTPNKPYKEPFAIIPWQVFADSRLRLYDIRVIGALLSYRSSTTGPFWATREQISAHCRIDVRNISNITKRLELIGYITRHREGRKPLTYEFQLPAFIPGIQRGSQPIEEGYVD